MNQTVSYRRCRFEVDDEVFPAVGNGLVTTCGSMASLWRWDARLSKYERLDRLRKIRVRDVGDGSLVIEGESTTSEGKLVVHVTPRSCTTCR